jgi:hypothetical protein
MTKNDIFNLAKYLEHHYDLSFSVEDGITDWVGDTRPSWGDAPEWANWLGQDANGGWYWFRERPEPGCDLWDGAPFERAVAVREWETTLQYRPIQIESKWMPRSGEDITDSVVVLFVTKHSVLFVDFHNKERLLDVDNFLQYYK